jgi:phospholipid/cholesterol/gamma-HCH transport system substrate-binding protein
MIHAQSGPEEQAETMFKGNNNFVVGLFVSIAIAVFVGFVLWLTGRSGTEEMSRYSMLFERDVSGLAIGGPVKFMGVNIGSVTSMEIMRDGDILIRVDINILENTPVDSGTFASLALQGITGVAVVNLDSDSGSHVPLELSPGLANPVIPVRDVGFAALMSSAPQIMDRLDTLLGQANQLLGEENRGSLEKSLGNIQSLTGSLAQSSETIADLPADINHTLTDIQNVAQQLSSLFDNVQPSLNSTLKNLNDASENLAGLTQKLDGWMQENEAGLNRFVEEGLGEAPELINSARETLRELEKLVSKLKNDPSQLVYRPHEESLEIEP